MVNNAGVTGFQEGFGPQGPENASLDSWRKVHAVNSDRTFLLVAERDGKIVGHAFLEPLHLKSICHVAQLSIGVHQGWQEKGIGTALMEQLITWAKESTTIEKIELNVRASNSRAIALYKKMRFVEEGRLKNRIKTNQGHYIDDILMALHVKEMRKDDAAED